MFRSIPRFDAVCVILYEILPQFEFFLRVLVGIAVTSGWPDRIRIATLFG